MITTEGLASQCHPNTWLKTQKPQRSVDKLLPGLCLMQSHHSQQSPPYPHTASSGSCIMLALGAAQPQPSECPISKRKHCKCKQREKSEMTFLILNPKFDELIVFPQKFGSACPSRPLLLSLHRCELI